MIADLLKQWSELEPYRCHKFKNDLMKAPIYRVVVDDPEREWITVAAFGSSERMSIGGLAVLQYALQQSISAHNFRLRLENSSDGWQAVVFTPDDAPNFSPYQGGDEPTIAILKSYLACLESERNHKFEQMIDMLDSTALD